MSTFPDQPNSPRHAELRAQWKPFLAKACLVCYLIDKCEGETVTEEMLATPAPQATDEEIRAWLAQQKAGSISVSETRCLPSGVLALEPTKENDRG